MSKTYRKTQKGRKIDWLPIISRWDIYGITRHGNPLAFGRKQDKIEWLQNNPHRAEDVGDYFYWMTTPSHWNRDYHTKPRRAQERELIHKVMHDKIDCEDVSWPTGKKPKIYYW